MNNPDDIQTRSEVSRVKSEHEEDILKLPNVTGIFTGTKVTGGVDTGKIAIVVTVSEKKDVPAKARIPTEINGVPTDVIEEEIIPMIASAVRVEEIIPFIDTTNYPTLEGGMSIGPCRSIHLEPPDVPAAGDYVFVGTLGCIVTDNASGDPMMLSNFHVMCVNDGWSAGDTMAQPSRVDGGSCPADQVGALQRAQLTASVDGAVASISGRPHDCSIIDIGDVNGTSVAAVDMAVRKRGRTTELTHGIVAATDYTTTVDYGDGLGAVTFTNQIRIVNDSAQSAFFGKKGDSGSVVVDGDNNVVGLYFAGNATGTVGVANQIAAVSSALNVTVCTGGIKKWEKEFAKDFSPDKGHFKLEKVEIKEIEVKERLKDYIKDWKEWAYEKFDWENVYEPWEKINPWERPPVVRQPPVVARPPVGGRPPLVAQPPVGVRGPNLRGMGDWKEVPMNGGCAEFSRLSEGNGPNPAPAPPFYISVFDYANNPAPNTRIVNWGGTAGLDLGFLTEIKIDGRCPVVQATLIQFAQPATMEAYNSDGSLAGTATMGDTQAIEQTLTVSGSSIEFVRIISPSNETILVRLCCCCETSCTPCKDKEKDKDKDKELHKDFHKEIQKELQKEKEFWKDLQKEKELSKDIQKEFQKEIKEIRETGLTRPGVEDTAVEERLAALEAMMGMGGTSHFIPASQRPDLGRGALRNEPGANANARLRRQGRR